MRPKCADCKWFIPNKNNKDEYGLCNLFNNKISCGSAEVIIHNYALHCRMNPNLCGIYGNGFDKLHSKEKMNSEIINELQTLQKKLLELENSFNGEIYEKNDIIKFEEELKELQDKIKNYRDN
uniref:Uncharacterized protein n=1 Tax=viral metagenome TaxID=1070528 RepID=A0A6C0EQG3_9ZZZZ